LRGREAADARGLFAGGERLRSSCARSPLPKPFSVSSGFGLAESDWLTLGSHRSLPIGIGAEAGVR
jgi:hypothetical protein